MSGSFDNAPKRKKAAPLFHLNLEKETSTKIPHFVVNIGKGIVVEVKEFRKIHYVGFSKLSNTNDVKNRFNIPIDQIESTTVALEAVRKHVVKHSKTKED